MTAKGTHHAITAYAAAACAALALTAVVGTAGLVLQEQRTAEAVVRGESSLATLQSLAAVRERMQAQSQAWQAALAGEPAARERALEQFDTHGVLVQSAIAQLRGRDGLRDAQALAAAHKEWTQALSVKQARGEADPDAAHSQEQALLGRVDRLTGGLRDARKRAVELAAAERRSVLWIAGGALFLLAVGGIALLAGYGRRLVVAGQGAFGATPAQLVEAARRLAVGDLSAAEALPAAEPGSLAASLKAVAQGLRSTGEELRGNAHRLSAAAAELAAASAQIASDASEQSAAAAAMASTVGQMSASITQVTEHSHTALRISRESGELSDHASGVVASASGELESVAESGRELTEIMQALGQRSGQISTIVNVIQEIAGQTNLLALNAAIEAARAGEQGRGFSVVADEVRKLADRTTESTREIAAMIKAIQEGTGQAVDRMEKWGLRVSDGVAKAHGAGECMQKIRVGANEVVQAVDRVSGVLAEQSGASGQIAAAVERISAMSHQGVQAVGAVGGAAQAVQQLAHSLNALATRLQPDPAHA
jgi:methyl-accepting chemotaxis protein